MTLKDRVEMLDKKFQTLYQRWYRGAVRNAKEGRRGLALERRIRMEKLLDEWDKKNSVYRGLATLLGSIPEGKTPVYLTREEKTKLFAWLSYHVPGKRGKDLEPRHG